MTLKGIQLDPEFHFKTSRSGGAGGQNVNKVSTKVELDFDVMHSALLTPEQKEIILDKLSHKINKEGILQIVAQTERSQLGNKEIAIKKFYTLLNSCFVVKKKRKATRPSRTSKEKRLQTKKRDSEIKRSRQSKWE
jgi:ribosome-associated protein